MHDASDIVVYTKMWDFIFSPHLEVILTAWCDILPIYGHIIVTIERVLHVMEAESMNKLMNDGEKPEAASANCVRL